MKTLFGSLVACMLLLRPAWAQEKGIRFCQDSSWREVLERARHEQKLVFLDCYTSWCGPCRKLAAEVFTQERLGDYFNTHFVNVRMDMEKGEGPSLYPRFDISYYPTLLLINPEGYILGRIDGAGAKTPDDLLHWGEAANRLASVVPFAERFEDGDRGDSLIRAWCGEYLATARPARVDSVLHRLVEDSGARVLYKKVCFDLIQWVKIDAPEAIFFARHHRRFAELYGEETVCNKLYEMFTHPLLLHTRLFEPGPPHRYQEKGYQGFIREIERDSLPDPAFFETTVRFFLACQRGDSARAMDIADTALAQGTAWQYYRMAVLAATYGSLKMGKPAADWARKARTLSRTDSLRSQCDRLTGALAGGRVPPALLNPLQEIYYSAWTK
jgi:thiol-disulfide isomerase/thioredoxin